MAGGAVGAAFRYQLGLAAYRLFGPGFPWGTWMANILGGFLMGLLVAVLARHIELPAEPLRLLLGVGVLGGFTTFSSFSLEAYQMLARGDNLGAASYAVASVAGSLLALIAGIGCARVLA